MWNLMLMKALLELIRKEKIPEYPGIHIFWEVKDSEKSLLVQKTCRATTSLISIDIFYAAQIAVKPKLICRSVCKAEFLQPVDDRWPPYWPLKLLISFQLSGIFELRPERSSQEFSSSILTDFDCKFLILKPKEDLEAIFRASAIFKIE